jgi:hypothetical protein
MRKPARMPGKAAGNKIFQMMAWVGKLKLCAMRIRLRGAASTPLKVAMIVGKNTPDAMVTSFGVSPMPSHRISSGSNAIFGIG